MVYRHLRRAGAAVATAFGAQRFAKKQMTKKKYKSGTSAGKKSKSRLASKLMAGKYVVETQPDMGGDAQITKQSVTIGRPQSLQLRGKARKLISGSQQTQILRFSGISPFMNTSGAPLNVKKLEVGGGSYWLHNFYDGSAFWYSPVHIYDVTSLNNVITTGGVATYTAATPGWQLRFVGVPGTSVTNVSFANLNNQQAGGAAAGGVWQAEDTAALGSNAGSQPLRSTLQDWTQAKLMCYGSAKMATQYVVEFIQLKEDWLHPEFCNLGPPTMTGQDYTGAGIQFWEHYSKPYMAHPLQSVAPLKRKLYKVLKTIRFTLQPRSSTETDANVGHCKQLNIFYHLNRICKYDWAENTVDINPGGNATYASSQGALSTYVHPRARIYMTVRATNITYANNTTPTVDYTPSYDLLLRKKYTTIQ